MTEKAIEFLQEWISEKVHAAPHEPIRLEQKAEVLARECARQAADAGVLLEDIEEEVGDLEELIATKLEDAAESGNRCRDKDMHASKQRAKARPANLKDRDAL